MAAEVAQLQHAGLAGQLRELLVRELLRPIVPSYVGFGSGKIVDHLGHESRQIDLIVYDNRMMPPLLFATDESVGLYPVEACVYAVEIKTKATAKDVRHAIEVGSSVGGLQYVPEYCRDGVPLSRVFTVLFAFGSTTRSSETEAERWRNSQHGKERAGVVQQIDAAGTWQIHMLPPLMIACVVGRGYGYYDPSKGSGSFGWLYESPYAGYEVLSCMAGVSNTLLKRGQVPALPFGRYLV